MLCCVVRVSTHRTFTPAEDHLMKRRYKKKQFAHPLDVLIDTEQTPDGSTRYIFIGGKDECRYLVYCPPIRKGEAPACYLSDADLQWQHECYWQIYGRLVRQQMEGTTKLLVSVREWRILQHFRLNWLDSYGTLTFKRPNPFMTNGRLGTFRGIPVHVDAEYTDDLPPRPNPG